MQRLPLFFCALFLASCAGATAPSPIPVSAQGTMRTHDADANFKSVFSFDGADGKEPYASLIAVGGALYGTTYGGGAHDSGTVFKVSPTGVQSVLHSFKDGMDGSLPQSSLSNVQGTLYGTTIEGGGPGEEGVVFKTTSSGAESVIHRFAGGDDGASPYAGLTAIDGVLYGTTAAGGMHSEGTVFKLTTAGKESVLYSFGSVNGDGATPVSRLIDVNGALYGTTSYGGSQCGSLGCGSVFKITTSGAEKVLHSFKGRRDGSNPAAALTNLNGTFYGTTTLGGLKNAGTVFKLTSSGAESVIYSFKGGADGASPQALVELNGRLYGTASAGGSKRDGTVFSITTSGHLSVLHTFAGGTDGATPRAGLRKVNGVLYGTTVAGGSHKAGTIFSLTP
jgi:uncharacterized repeat protein (TIGR03803 family)